MIDPQNFFAVILTPILQRAAENELPTYVLFDCHPCSDD